MDINTTKDRAIVAIESPFKGDVPRNKKYARACMRDCFMKNEIPFASHLLYTQRGILDDTRPTERKIGIATAFELLEKIKPDKHVIYTDLGVSDGMVFGIIEAKLNGRDVEYRELGCNWEAEQYKLIEKWGY